MPWQSDAWQLLNKQLEGEQLPHALLLGGVAQTGKNRLALALARLLLCRSPEAGLNCGHCHACEMSRAGTHGDFRWLEPQGKSRIIKIDQVREVVDFGGKTASLGQRKVVVFSPAEDMNANAANALLKSLEEPAADTYLLLVCHRLHGLPATIRSRCQQVRLPTPTREQSLAWLDPLTGERSESEKLLNLADDRPLAAETIFYSGDTAVATAIPAAMDTLRNGNSSVPQLVALLGQLPVEEALAQIGSYLQRCIRNAGRDSKLTRDFRQAFALLDEVGRLQSAVASGANPNGQLLLESLLARVQKELGGG